MHIDEIDHSLPYASRYKSGMIIPGGVNICNSTSDAEYYKVTSIVNISCPERIETAWIARELNDGGGFSIRWAVEPVTYENIYSIGDRVIDDTTKKTFEINGLAYKIVDYRRATKGEQYLWLVDNNQPRVGFSVRDSTDKHLIVVPVEPEWKYETAFRLGDVVEDSTIDVRYAGKFCISAYRIPQAKEYYLSRCFTSEKATLVNHTGNKGFWEYSQSYWILEKVFDYETDFKIGQVVTDRVTKKQYRIVSYEIPSASSRIISRFSTQTSVAIVASGTTDKRWIVEPVETNPYLVCSPSELWSYI